MDKKIQRKRGKKKERKFKTFHAYLLRLIPACNLQYGLIPGGRKEIDSPCVKFKPCGGYIKFQMNPK